MIRDYMTFMWRHHNVIFMSMLSAPNGSNRPHFGNWGTYVPRLCRNPGKTGSNNNPENLCEENKRIKLMGMDMGLQKQVEFITRTTGLFSYSAVEVLVWMRNYKRSAAFQVQSTETEGSLGWMLGSSLETWRQASRSSIDDQGHISGTNFPS